MDAIVGSIGSFVDFFSDLTAKLGDILGIDLINGGFTGEGILGSLSGSSGSSSE